MDFSKKQILLLESFYKEKTIPYSKLSQYGTFSHSPLILSLTKEQLIKTIELYPKDGYPPHTFAYIITDKGEGTYETIINNQKRSFWTNFRSWLAIIISVIAIIVSIFF